ncbi:hypothetical protein [Myroides sp. WP-1]|uniref:hypothetical protein n=1 Tax=Myroides sp. WP-1 TaxID=2759944 RepID=UPI0015FAC1E1|nr:hypothetical protein [Myroides sp. WP-1]MBB1138066.1 hypothetical protein [Myroides sp. WP-1]
MVIVEPYLFFLVLLFLSFFIALVWKKKTLESIPYSPRPVKITLWIVILYFVVKYFFGWQLTSWYAEAILLLGVFVTLDYFVLVKNYYTKKLRSSYILIRMGSIMLPILAIVLTTMYAYLSLGWGQYVIGYAFPLDTKHGEQWICKNLYIYKNDRENLVGSFVFKKKFLFLEKDVARVGGRYGSVFGVDQPSNVPLTGYVDRETPDVVYIYGRKGSRRQVLKQYFRILALESNYVKIEYFEFDYDSISNNTAIERYDIKL